MKQRNIMNHEIKEKTKKCKYCKSEIPYDATVCPVCRKTQDPPAWAVAMGLIIIILFVIIEVLNVNDHSSEKENKESDKKVYGVGDTVENNGIEVTLISAKSNAGNAYLKPGEGKMFEVLEFEIANNSGHDIVVSSITAFEAYCDDYTANFDIRVNVLYNDKNQLDGNVADGKKIKGVIGYEVPTDFTKLEVTCKPSFWSSYSVKYEIMNEQ